MGQIDPRQVLLWAQVGGQMVQLVATTVDGVKKALTATGASEAEMQAKLAQTHALYDAAIAREEQIANTATE
jgi:hypothetical protein